MGNYRADVQRDRGASNVILNADHISPGSMRVHPVITKLDISLNILGYHTNFGKAVINGVAVRWWTPYPISRI